VKELVEPCEGAGLAGVLMCYEARVGTHNAAEEGVARRVAGRGCAERARAAGTATRGGRRRICGALRWAAGGEGEAVRGSGARVVAFSHFALGLAWLSEGVEGACRVAGVGTDSPRFGSVVAPRKAAARDRSTRETKKEEPQLRRRIIVAGSTSTRWARAGTRVPYVLCHNCNYNNWALALTLALSLEYSAPLRTESSVSAGTNRVIIDDLVIIPGSGSSGALGQSLSSAEVLMRLRIKASSPPWRLAALRG
jgi:hypothetical protein